MEINIAFFTDVCSELRKSSALKKNERIALAFISLIEEAILFTGVYMIIGDCNTWETVLRGCHSLIMNQPDFGCHATIFLEYVGWYQLLCSLILITLAFASYIGNKEDI